MSKLITSWTRMMKINWRRRKNFIHDYRRKRRSKNSNHDYRRGNGGGGGKTLLMITRLLKTVNIFLMKYNLDEQDHHCTRIIPLIWHPNLNTHQ